MSYGDFKDLIRRTASDKILLDTAFNIAKNPRYDGFTDSLIKKLLVVLLKMKICQTKI